MSLFVLASKDGWVNIMYHGLDAVGIDQQVPRLSLLRRHTNSLNAQTLFWVNTQTCSKVITSLQY